MVRRGLSQTTVRKLWKRARTRWGLCDYCGATFDSLDHAACIRRRRARQLGIFGLVGLALLFALACGGAAPCDVPPQGKLAEACSPDAGR